MMEALAIRLDLSEPKELAYGLWALPGSNVCRAGLCLLELYDDYDFVNNPKGLNYITN